MTELLHELTAAFVEDTTPLVEDFVEAVLALERALRDGQAWDEILRLVRARLHTIKGNAGMVGQARIVELSHALEDACAVGSLDESQRAGWVDLLLQGADLLAALVAAGGQGHEPTFAALKAELATLSGDAEVPTLEPPLADANAAEIGAARPLLRVDLTDARSAARRAR
jgi:chemotaxis protein histidine kinase CheA